VPSGVKDQKEPNDQSGFDVETEGQESDKHLVEVVADPKNIKIGKQPQQAEEVTRRNFYLTLFRQYASIPFSDCLTSFTKIFNDVFVHERPSCVHKYSLAAVMVVEMLNIYDEDMAAKLNVTHKIPFTFNFLDGSSKDLQYLAVPAFHEFLNKAVR